MINPALEQAFADHAAMLRERLERTRNLPEDIFLDYVQNPRIHDERVEFFRRRFFAEYFSRVRENEAEYTVLDLNRILAGQAEYAPTDARTLNAGAVLRRGFGRCGELSTVLTDVCRALGVAARQVYASYWSHCDDNHAWVEVYVNGEWHHTGALEPEPMLDRGWYIPAASRAMLIRVPVGEHYEQTHSPETCRKEGLFYYRGRPYITGTPRYARTLRLHLSFLHEDGRPAAGTALRLYLYNDAALRPLLDLKADEQGRAELILGRGTVLMAADLGEEHLVKVLHVHECEDGDDLSLTLKQQSREEAFAALPSPYVQKAPDSDRRLPTLDEGFLELRRRLLAQAAEERRLHAHKRQIRAEQLGRELISRCPEAAGLEERLLSLLKQSAGNAAETARLLTLPQAENALSAEAVTTGGWDTLSLADRTAVLEALPEKDLVDLKADEFPAAYLERRKKEAEESPQPGLELRLRIDSEERLRCGITVLDGEDEETVQEGLYDKEQDVFTFKDLPRKTLLVCAAKRLRSGDCRIWTHIVRADELRAAGDCLQLALDCRSGLTAEQLEEENGRLCAVLPEVPMLSMDKPMGVRAARLDWVCRPEGLTALYILDEGSEPDCHVLQELVERGELPDCLIMAHKTKALINRIRKAFPTLTTDRCYRLLHPETVEELARACFLPDARLPMVLLLDPEGRAVYADNGYRVGMVDMAESMRSLSEQKGNG